MSGPFETERQAADAARHIYDSPPGTGAWGDGNHRLMEDACTAAGVELGAYDHRILLWLAGWEPATCAVVAGLITRAHLPGMEDARAALLDPHRHSQPRAPRHDPRRLGRGRLVQARPRRHLPRL
jgi:hypothetical protein